MQVAAFHRANQFQHGFDIGERDNLLLGTHTRREFLADGLFYIMQHIFIVRVILQAQAGLFQVLPERVVSILVQAKHGGVTAQIDLFNRLHSLFLLILE